MEHSSNTSDSEDKFEIVSFEEPHVILEFLVSVGSKVVDDQPLFICENGYPFLSSHYGIVTDVFVKSGGNISDGENILRIENTSRRNLLTGSTSTTLSTDENNDYSKRNTRLIDAALDCLKSGQACNDHCIELVKGGDTSIADCMASVIEMLATCTALSQMASYQSKRLAALTEVCILACEDCEEECSKHEFMHAECKACAASCQKFIKACEK